MRVEERARTSGSHRLVVEESDLSREPAARLRWMAQALFLIRAFEEKALELKAKDLVNGPVHTSIGQEAVAVGAAWALRRTDKIAGTHRAHHQYLAKAAAALAPEGSDPLDGLPLEIGEAVRVLLAEVMGLRDGCCGGRGGSMHLCDPQVGVAGTNAIVGGGIPMATGTAWADLRSGRDSVTVCFFGDGALYQGTLHEAANLAALWKVPIIYFIENNSYAVGTARRDSCSARELDDVATAYGMPSLQVDGMDPFAVAAAVAHVRRTRVAALLRRGGDVEVLPPCRGYSGQRLRLPQQGGRGGLARAGPGHGLPGAPEEDRHPGREDRAGAARAGRGMHVTCGRGVHGDEGRRADRRRTTVARPFDPGKRIEERRGAAESAPGALP